MCMPYIHATTTVAVPDANGVVVDVATLVVVMIAEDARGTKAKELIRLQLVLDADDAQHETKMDLPSYAGDNN